MTFNPQLLSMSDLNEAARFVYKFQTDFGIGADGKAGARTYSVLLDLAMSHRQKLQDEGMLPKNEGGMSDIRPVGERLSHHPLTGPVLDQQPVVRFKRLPHGSSLPIPAYETPGAAAMDLRAADEGFWLKAGEIVAVRTGFEVAIPPGYEGQVRPRSGLAAKHGITVLNSPGTIDSDYRGEIKIILANHSSRNLAIAYYGDRIAQLVIAPVSRAAVEEVTELDQTERGAGGFGSTGVK